MSEAWRVERAGRELLARIHEIAAASFDAPWTEGAFEEEFATPESSVWVARAADGAVSGYLIARRMLDEVHVLSFAVAPEARRRGAGSALLRSALAAEQKEGARLAHLEVRAGNPAALAFYVRHGFQSIGRRRHYYPGGEDALLFAAVLGAPRASGAR